MSKQNEMRMYTWNLTGLNFIDEAIKAPDKKPYFKESDADDIPSLNDAFSGKTYGVSEEILKENKNFRNFSVYRDINGNSEFEKIDLTLNDENNILVSNIDINAAEDSVSTFLVNVNGEGDKLYLNSLIRVNLGKRAKVKLVIATNMTKDSTNIESIATILAEDAKLDISYIEIGASHSLVNIRNILEGDRSRVVEDGIYFKEGEEFLDILATNEHYGNDTDSDAMFNGALKDRTKKNWKGVVDLRQGCVSANGKIGDYSMMFSDEVKNKTAPILLCAEKEVAGNHAASVGRLNKDMLFYIMSRGFDKKQAESMMLQATFAKTLDKIEDESLRESLRKRFRQMNTRN